MAMDINSKDAWVPHLGIPATPTPHCPETTLSTMTNADTGLSSFEFQELHLLETSTSSGVLPLSPLGRQTGNGENSAPP